MCKKLFANDWELKFLFVTSSITPTWEKNLLLLLFEIIPSFA